MNKEKNAILPFHFQNADIRIINQGGDPWFVAKDVCDILGLTNPTMAVSNLDEDERSKFYLGRQGEVVIISESGLYALIFRSNKPIAKKFRKWVTSEVIPQIRKTGQYQPTPDYATQSSIDKLIDLYNETLEQLENLGVTIEGANVIKNPRFKTGQSNFGSHLDLQEQLALIREARQVHGKKAAQALWEKIGLPEIAETTPFALQSDDGIEDFARECIITAPKARIKSADLYKAYEYYMQTIDKAPVTASMFYRAFARLGYLKCKIDGGVAGYNNIKVEM